MSEAGSAGERMGVLVLRAWVEAGDGAGFKARILTTSELAGDAGGVVVSSPEAALDVVARWMKELVAHVPRVGESG